jgi:hypothetical protein
MLVRALDVLHGCAIIGAEVGRVRGRQVSEAMPLQLGRVSAQVGRVTCSRRALDVLHACSTRSRREGSTEGMRSHALQEAAEKACSHMLLTYIHTYIYAYMAVVAMDGGIISRSLAHPLPARPLFTRRYIKKAVLNNGVKK